MMQRLAVLLFSCLALASCETAKFYSQAVGGQLDMLKRRQPLERVIEKAETPSKLRQRLKLIQEMRDFAQAELHLPIDAYDSYADLGRENAVYVVYAAPEFSLKPKTWRYPLIGEMGYRGFFKAADAKRCGLELKEQGYEVVIGGVDAYSTLGWFRDPVLNTFVYNDEADLAELLFHELTHRRLFLSGDTAFNEALATAVGQYGAQLWLKKQGKSETLRIYKLGQQREQDFLALIRATRAELAALYESKATEATKRKQKGDIFQRLKQRHLAMKKKWQKASANGPTFDAWFKRPLNNARFVPLATYHDLVPAFKKRIQSYNGDLEAFFKEMESLKRYSPAKRRQWLDQTNGARPYRG